MKNLRPARETCEQCHWPQKFHGDKVAGADASTRDDEANTRARPRCWCSRSAAATPAAARHGHPLAPPRRPASGSSTSRPTSKRQVIPWVTLRRRRRARRVEFASTRGQGDAGAARARGAAHDGLHGLPQPADATPSSCPSGRSTGRWRAAASPRAALHQEEGGRAAERRVPDRTTAVRRIARGLRGLLPDVPPARSTASRRAHVETRGAAGSRAIYARNVFPEMKVGWGTYPNNIGHEDFPGCFRCHDGHTSRRRPHDHAGLQRLPHDPGAGREGSEDPGRPGPEIARRLPLEGTAGFPARARSAAGGRSALVRRLPRLPRRQGPVGARGRSLFVDAARRRRACTTRLDCSYCHEGMREYPHPEPVPAASCASCHEDAARRSHERPRAAERRPEAPDCASCQGTVHEFLPRADPRSPVAKQPARDLRRLPREPGLHGAAPLPSRGRSRPTSESVHGRALAAGNGERRDLLRLPRHPRRRQARNPDSRINHWNVPATCGQCHQEIGSILGAASTARPSPRGLARGAGLHRLPRRARDPGARRAGLAREPGARLERHLRALPRRRAAGREVQPAAGQGPGLRGQLPRPGGARGLADASPTAPPATASTTSCRRATRARPSTPPTWPGPAAPAIPARASASRSARSTSCPRRASEHAAVRLVRVAY